MQTKKKRATWEDFGRSPTDVAQDVLNRMRINHEAGKGINLTYAELCSLKLTQVGDLWTQDDPRESDPGI